MNPEQIKAAKRLRSALVGIGKAGLAGGVYDGNFCVYPANQRPSHDIDFFYNVEKKVGEILWTPGVDLDGGAGV